jgi:hypothetical protein
MLKPNLLRGFVVGISQVVLNVFDTEKIIPGPYPPFSYPIAQSL